MIRPANNSDIPEITNLVYSIVREYGMEPDPVETDLDLQDIEKNYSMNGGSFDVLLNDSGKIVGTVGIYKLSEETCELRKMYLDLSERGQGKGKVLLEHGISRAKKFGFTRITLETAKVLIEAISLYRKYGFQKYEAEHISCRCDQAYYLDIRR